MEPSEIGNCGIRVAPGGKMPKDFFHPSFHGWIGIHRADITPPVGIYSRNWGAAKHDVADSIHRRLTLSVMTLAPLGGGDPLVFVDVDLGWWKTPNTFRDFQTRLLLALGLGSQNLILALSHTHSAPPLMDTDDSLPGSGLLRLWMENVFQTTLNSVRAALGSQFSGTLDWGVGRCDLASIRDLPDPDSNKERVLCGFNPEGKPEDTLLVGRITNSAGRICAILTNYACHPTTLAWQNSAISPDYVGAMRETIEQSTGGVSLFMIGACGDLAPRFQYVGDTLVADRHGFHLGYAVLGTLHGMEPPGTCLVYDGPVESGATLAVWRHKPRELSQKLASRITLVRLPLKDWPSANELEQQRLACNDRALEERLRRKRDIRRGIGDGTTFDLPIYAWRIGDAVLVGCCAEPYSILQVELRRSFPGRTIVCMNLINGSIGYLPPAHLFDTNIYPVWQTPFDRGCLELVITSMIKAVNDVLCQ